MTNLLVAASAILVAYVSYVIVYDVLLHPLARFPGPPLAKVTVYWKAYIECILKKSFCDELRELHERYGKAFMNSNGIMR